MSFLRKLVEIGREALRRRPPNYGQLVILRGVLLDERRALARIEAVERYWTARLDKIDASLGGLEIRIASAFGEHRSDLLAMKRSLEKSEIASTRGLTSSYKMVRRGQEKFDEQFAAYCAMLSVATHAGYDTTGLELVIDEDVVEAEAEVEPFTLGVDDPIDDDAEFVSRLRVAVPESDVKKLN